MTDGEQLAFIKRVVACGDADDLWWRLDGDRVRFFANCNDVFYWACADAEEITPNNIVTLEQAVKDCEATVGNRIYAVFLFTCRVRGMRPQGAAYPSDEKLWPLFDASGPERVTDMGNPKKHPRDRKESKKDQPDCSA